MKKVILLNGSPRVNGNTNYLLEECKKAIEENGVEAEIVQLAGKNVHSCVECLKCVELKRCVFDDDGINDIIEKLKTADGFIIGAPVYYGTARGDIMSAIQRIGYVSARSGLNYLQHKVGGPIAVGRRGGHTATIQEMLMFYFINEMIVPGSNHWNIAFGREIGAAAQDTEGVATIKRFGKNVAQLINKLKD